MLTAYRVELTIIESVCFPVGAEIVHDASEISGKARCGKFTESVAAQRQQY